MALPDFSRPRELHPGGWRSSRMFLEPAGDYDRWPWVRRELGYNETPSLSATCGRSSPGYGDGQHLSSRIPGGGMRWVPRILRMVPAPTRWPRRRSSPWTLTTPQMWFWRGQANDQRDDLLGQWRVPWWPGLAPLPGHHAAAPAKQRAGSNDPVAPQLLRQDPAQRREHSPISPADPRLRVGATQDRDLLPQDQYLGILRRRRPGRQHQPGQHHTREAVDQTNRHKHQSSQVRAGG